jgi:4,4'-diaponeurosporenoate glycosyltransferase
MSPDWFAPPGVVGTLVFLVGWAAGWVGYLRAARLPATTDVRRTAVSVVVPCRNEAENLRRLLPNLASVLRDDDQVIVVDDDSSDGTLAVAREFGTTVVSGSALPTGWAGKPHACWQGVQHASREVVVFLDADVRLGPGAVDDLVSLLDEHPDAVVSVMPWHRTGSAVERLSMTFNTVSMMVACLGATDRRRVAYGPFLAVRRDPYLAVGGHAHAEVRAAVVEDLALARVMPRSVARIGGAHRVEYRMYPRGFRQMVEGWTKNTAIGAVSVPRWSAILVVAWVASLCGGPVTSVWCYALSVVQVRVLSRRAGNFGWGSAVLYPLHAATFAVVAARSAVQSALFGSVAWRGRSVATR